MKLLDPSLLSTLTSWIEKQFDSLEERELHLSSANVKIKKDAKKEPLQTIDVHFQGEESHAVQLNTQTEEMESSCSCQAPLTCKHRVAAALQLLQKLQASQNTPSHLSKESLSWLEEFKESSPVEKEQENVPFVIVYLLDRTSDRKNRLSISIGHAKKKKNGEPSSSRVRGYSPTEALRWPDKLKQMATKEDWELIQHIWQRDVNQEMDDYTLLQNLVKTNRCFWGELMTGPLSWGTAQKRDLGWRYLQGNQQRIELQMQENEVYFLCKEKGIYIQTQKAVCGPLQLPTDAQKIRSILTSPSVSSQQAITFQEKLSSFVKDIRIQEKPIIHLSKREPTPHLHISLGRYYTGTCIQVHLSFFYGKDKVSDSTHPETICTIDKKEVVYQFERNKEAELQFVLILKKFGFYESYREKGAYFKEFSCSWKQATIDKECKEFCQNFVVPKRKQGWAITFDHQFPYKEETIHDLSRDSLWYVDAGELNNDWFDVEIGTIIDGTKINLIPFLQKIFQDLKGNLDLLPEGQTIELQGKEGEKFHLPTTRLKSILSIFFGLLEEKEGNKLKLSQWHAPLLSDLSGEFSQGLQWQVPKHYEKVQELLKNIEKIEKIDPPKGLQCELRSYQIEGVSWLQFLRQCNLAGILADDMGLGKTIQTLAHILIEKESGRMNAPAFIVAPTTLMGNWLQEAKRFTPGLKVLILQGLDRKRFFDQMSEYDLILTTYPLLARDQEVLLKMKFYFLILDEAQNIKNSHTQAHHVLREIQAKYKLCLTGTPMENHLGELWSFFHILLPGFLGTENQFQKWFRKPIEKEGSLERKVILQKRIHPFMLRRTKQQVVLDLPPKTEILTPIELSPKQKDLYEAVRMTMMEKVMTQVQEKGLAQSHITILDALLKLRQTCCDPRLLKKTEGESISQEDSAKMTYLKETLPQLIEEKRKILLFSQFTSMLALIEELLISLGIPYTMITGETQDRITPVEEFQSGIKPIFLISLKAGGTGLNLTAADTVIMYDPWWNPAVESQAIDRAYRIGQTKPVFVYKLIASGSVEEKIVALQGKKKEMAAGLFDSSNTTPLEMDLQELHSLFTPLEP